MLTSAQRREIEDLVASGQKIAAVKRYREITSVGLQEALHAVEQIAGPAVRDLSAAVAAPDGKALREAEAAAMAALREGNVVEAIKRYRQHTRLGLKEAKDAVDALNVVERTGGRINAKLARSLMAMVGAGQKQEAITLMMSNAGYDEAEAAAFIKTLGSFRLGGRACGGGCIRMLITFAVLAAAFIYFVWGYLLRA